MTTPSPFTGSRRVLVAGLLRALLSTVLVVVLYFVLPLDRVAAVSPWISLPVAVIGFTALVAVQVRAIFRSAHPGVRAVEALGATVPLFIVAFASVYYVMGVADPSWFSEEMSKLDALYFTITVFATVGFGDITATAPPTRAVVTGQMVANLVVIGLGLRIILGAVQEARRLAGRATLTD